VGFTRHDYKAKEEIRGVVNDYYETACDLAGIIDIYDELTGVLLDALHTAGFFSGEYYLKLKLQKISISEKVELLKAKLGIQSTAGE
jgi:hypothetical protein